MLKFHSVRFYYTVVSVFAALTENCIDKPWPVIFGSFQWITLKYWREQWNKKELPQCAFDVGCRYTTTTTTFLDR